MVVTFFGICMLTQSKAMFPIHLGRIFIPVGEGGGDGEMKDEQYEQSAAGSWQYWANSEARVISARGRASQKRL